MKRRLENKDWTFLVWKHFAHFGLESGMVFEGTTGSYTKDVFIVSIPNE